MREWLGNALSSISWLPVLTTRGRIERRISVREVDAYQFGKAVGALDAPRPRHPRPPRPSTLNRHLHSV